VAIAAIATILGAYLVPQFLYRRAGAQWLVPFVPLLRLMEFSTRPFTALVSFLDSLAELGSGSDAIQEAGKNEEPIDALIDAGREEGIIAEQDRKLIQSVVAFGDKTVREVMTPRPRIVAIDISRPLEDLRRLVIHEQYSRVPVFEGSVDNILGFVHVRDMFELDAARQESTTLRQLLRPIDYVPESKPASALLRDMQDQGAHMALVIDEYGNTAGLVTLEDLVEEILGEIRDEHEPSADVTREASGAIVVAGSYDVDGLRDLVGFRPDDETQSTTVAGLVTEWLGRVPRPGETVDRDGIRIEVLASNDLRVDRVRISSWKAPEVTKEEAADV
jgi:CBS domain containing-hemolysin-like protein